MRYFIFFFLFTVQVVTAQPVRFSTAGFYQLANTGREVYSMNQAWKFIKSDVVGDPHAWAFDDSAWEVVSVPHGLEYLPLDASGGINYQGVSWYRKRFTPENKLQGKRLFLHFEAIMGKSKIWVNGMFAGEHYGGYLPVIIDVTDLLEFGKENVIAVKTDNSDDPDYPIGKPQNLLDFTYFGGIYRDCWLVAHNDVYITDPNYENEVAGGGLFVSYDKVSEQSALVNLKAHIRNAGSRNRDVSVLFELRLPDETVVQSTSKKLSVRKGRAAHVVDRMKVSQPRLWSPDSPHLYYLDVTVRDEKGNRLDGYRQRIGIRSIEFKALSGLWINGKPYQGKIMGTNRHQDFAVLGNALPNSIQWRDAKKLRDAGMKVIRTHYVIDPAFMDACDELGLFALVEVPGWQFWSNKPIFGERVCDDIRNMIRIHRNHASLFFWEPILNETHYPKEFAEKARKICDEEYPYPYSTASCDDGAAGDEYYSLLLRPRLNMLKPDKTYFVREWGDNVDDWNAQNSNSRVARNWGESPMLIQA
ncbi:glycoside hydrolase family 2 protein, partial [Parabacteroides sp. OttesenSCG-928-G06]|nr:glycoside hydrolase family 2 protein [Parabacteroides sp. OttesenSCG-928-G06]